MSLNAAKEKTSVESFSKFPNEGIEMLSQIPDIYKKMTDAWLSFAKNAASNGNKPTDITKLWTDSFGSVSKDFYQTFCKSCSSIGLPIPNAAVSDQREIFKSWQNMLQSFPLNLSSKEGIKEFSLLSVEMSDKLRESYANLAKSQFDILQKLLKANKSGEPEQILNTYSESAKMVFESLFSFFAERTNANLKVMKSLFPTESSVTTKTSK